VQPEKEVRKEKYPEMIRVHPENVVNKDNTLDKCPAANLRFCESGAVTPQKKQCENENLYPA
jgi:hypothetical protein